MKTPMQKAIDILKADQKHSGNTFTKINYGHAIELLKNLLEEEKEVITKSWMDGKQTKNFGNTIQEDAENYFNETFKND